MASLQEQAAGTVTAWVAAYGDADVANVTDDVVEILRICHRFRSQEGQPPRDAGELADEIARYAIESFGPAAEDFDKVE